MKIRAFNPTTVIAVIALLFSLTGTAVAGALVTGANVKNGTLSGLDVRNESLGSADIKNGTIKKIDIKGGQFPAGPQGPQGPQGEQGRAGPGRPAGRPRPQRPPARASAARPSTSDPSKPRDGDLPGRQEGRRRWGIPQLQHAWPGRTRSRSSGAIRARA